MRAYIIEADTSFRMLKTRENILKTNPHILFCHGKPRFIARRYPKACFNYSHQICSKHNVWQTDSKNLIWLIYAKQSSGRTHQVGSEHSDRFDASFPKLESAEEYCLVIESLGSFLLDVDGVISVLRIVAGSSDAASLHAKEVQTGAQSAASPPATVQYKLAFTYIDYIYTNLCKEIYKRKSPHFLEKAR